MWRLKTLPLSTAVLTAALILGAASAQADPFRDLFARHPKDETGQTTPATGLPSYSGPKKRLAIEALEVKVTAPAANGSVPGGPTSGNAAGTPVSLSPPTDLGTGLTEMLTTELSKTNRFILLERASLGDVTGEQKLTADPTFDPASAPKPGGLLGAQILIRGAITSFSYTTSGTSTQGVLRRLNSALGGALGGATGTASGVPADTTLGGGFSTCKASLTLDLRLIDAASGQVLDSVSAAGSSSSSIFSMSASEASASLGTSLSNSSPLGLAVHKAIDSAVYQICTDQSLNTLPWEAQVAGLDGDGGPACKLYLDCGSASGVKAGDILTVLQPGAPIISPATRLMIGHKTSRVLGHCRVDSVLPEMATASVLDGTGFEVGQAVHFASAASVPIAGNGAALESGAKKEAAHSSIN